MNTWRTVVAFGIGVLCSPALATDSCVTVFSDSIRNLNFELAEQKTYDTAFMLHCSESGELTEHGLTTGFKMFVDVIDGASNGKYKNSTVEEFCRTEASVQQSKNFEVTYVSAVQIDALRTFNQCESILSKSQVLMSHTSGIYSINFHIEIPENVVFDVDAIVVSPGVRCFAPLGLPVVVAGEAPPFFGVSSSRFTESTNISCVRPVEERDDGAVYAPPVEITVATSASDYQVSMPQDVVYTAQLASETQNRIDELEVELAAKNAKVAELTSSLKAAEERFAGLVIRANAAFSGGGPNPGGHGAEIPIDDDILPKLCPNALLSEKIPLGEREGLRFYSTACLFDAGKAPPR